MDWESFGRVTITISYGYRTRSLAGIDRRAWSLYFTIHDVRSAKGKTVRLSIVRGIVCGVTSNAIMYYYRDDDRDVESSKKKRNEDIVILSCCVFFNSIRHFIDENQRNWIDYTQMWWLHIYSFYQGFVIF